MSGGDLEIRRPPFPLFRSGPSGSSRASSTCCSDSSCQHEDFVLGFKTWQLALSRVLPWRRNALVLGGNLSGWPVWFAFDRPPSHRHGAFISGLLWRRLERALAVCRSSLRRCVEPSLTRLQRCHGVLALAHDRALLRHPFEFMNALSRVVCSVVLKPCPAMPSAAPFCIGKACLCLYLVVSTRDSASSEHSPAFACCRDAM
jgi:hypothetical protein